MLGHITAVAKLIARSPSLWDKTVPRPDPLGLGATYLARARGFLREARVTIDGYLTPQYVDPASKLFRHPDNDAYGMLMQVGHLRGKTVPWNQMAMLAGGYLDVAETLDLLGEQPGVVAEYDRIVKAYADAFFAKVTRGEVMGQPVYTWSYADQRARLPISRGPGARRLRFGGSTSVRAREIRHHHPAEGRSPTRFAMIMRRTARLPKGSMGTGPTRLRRVAPGSTRSNFAPSSQANRRQLARRCRNDPDPRGACSGRST